MIDAIHKGKLKAMYLFGEEISLVDSNSMNNFSHPRLNYIISSYQDTLIFSLETGLEGVMIGDCESEYSANRLARRGIGTAFGRTHRHH